ncbi:uncharacterized protein [Onthophagus taurus]|uniref:uncharacterized protein n=1 Tax=Onthophagus taurus TaxID=166361 RepID=UPI0039BE6CF4
MSSEAEFSIFTVHELKYISQLFELPEKKRKLEIIKEIINSNYTVDEVKIEIMTWTENPQKGRLEKIEIEKKEKEEKERIERLEIAKLDTEVKLAQFRVQGISENSNFSNSNINSFNMNKYLQPFKDNGDMSLFLINFERVCIQLNCGKETWPLRLTSVLSPAANEVVARLSEEDAKDYDKVRASLLKKYQLTSEVFRAKFRYSKKKFDQTYAEFAYQLKNNFKEWIKCEGICSDINKLIQLICLEKFYSSIPSEMRFWVEDHNKTKSIEEAAEQADVYISKRGPINDRNGYNKFKQEHKTSTQRETNQNNPSNMETESERKGDKRSFDKRRPFKCYACGGIGHFKGSKECPNFKESKENKQVVATLNTKKEVQELFAPYTLKGEINGKEVNILRDSAASYDVVHKNIVKTEHYSGKYVHVRGVLNEESVALQVAVVKLNLPEIGELETEAAVTSNLPNGYSYLLSNRTWEMFSNVDNVQNVFALTRSKSKKLKLEQQSIPVEQNQKNEKHKELREQENKVNEKDKQKKEESVLEEMLIIPKGKTDYDDITKLNPNKLRLLQGGDPTLKEYYDKAEIKEDKNGVKFKILNGILHRRFVDKLGRHYEQVVVPTSLRGKIMDIAHDNMWMGHLGLERFHGVFKRILRALSYEHGKQWDEYFDQALFAVRSAPHAAHGFSPAELCYGRQIRSPLSMLKALWNGRDTNEPVVSYVLKLLERLKNMQEIVEISMKEAQNKSKKYYDKKAKEIIYKEGDKVMIYQPARTNKLQMQWEGPKKVVRKISDTNYILEELTGRRKQTLIHVNLLKPYYEKPEIVAMYVTSSGEEETEMNIYKLEKKEEATLLATEVLQQSKGIGEFTEEQRMDLENLIGEFPGLFSNRPGRTNLIQHDIALKEERIIRTKPYSQSPRVREIIDEEIDKMLNLGVIKPSDSPYSSPMIIIEIEGKEPRPVIDYRALNAISIPQQHPIPNIEACVERCSNAKYLSLIDVVRAYWQIGMTERASKYAAFITHRGVFEPVTLPFGLQSAPFSFQRLMDKILEGYNEFAEPYLDDIAIHSMTWKDHLKHLRLVFTAMHKAGLTIKAKKCEWGKAQVVYLGHKIGQGYRTPSEAKVAAIKEFRRPVTKKDIRIFLGITGYYNHYIPNYAEIVSPLTDALRKGAKNKVEWDEQKENAFNNLKQELTSSKVLKAPNYKRKFIVQTDCSKRGMGVTLSQRDDDNKEYPVLYLSKKLTEREQAYSASELECAALVWAVNKLKPYLYLTHFIIVTDHCPLTWLKQMSNKNARLLRWALSLQTLDFTVVYKPGKMCGNVDSLSRYNVEM